MPDLDDPEAFEDVDVVIHPSSVDLADYGLKGNRREIRIEWELDPVSGSTFAGRAQAFVGT